MRDVALTIADARRDYDRFVPSDTIPHLVAAYGSGYREVMELSRTPARVVRRGSPADSPVIGASWSGPRVTRWPKRCAMRSSAARRSARSAIPAIGSRPRGGAHGRERGWSETRTRDELESLRRFYERLQASDRPVLD